MDFHKFQAKWFAVDDDSIEQQWVADLTDELKFIENLRYWQIGINEFNNIYLVSLDSDYHVSFLEFLKLPDRIFSIYGWATPECFYELTGLVLCLSSIQKKYILHKQDSDAIPLIANLPQNLLDGLFDIHKILCKRK